MNENRINKFVVKSTDYITKTIRIILFQNCAYIGSTRINKFIVSFPEDNSSCIMTKWGGMLKGNIQNRLDMYFRHFYDTMHQMSNECFRLKGQYKSETNANIETLFRDFVTKFSSELSTKSFGDIKKVFRETESMQNVTSFRKNVSMDRNIEGKISMSQILSEELKQTVDQLHSIALQIQDANSRFNTMRPGNIVEFGEGLFDEIPTMDILGQQLAGCEFRRDIESNITGIYQNLRDYNITVEAHGEIIDTAFVKLINSKEYMKTWLLNVTSRIDSVLYILDKNINKGVIISCESENLVIVQLKS